MWLNKTQAIKRLGASRSDFVRLIRDGKIEVVEYYGHRRYSEESIARCIEAHRYDPNRGREIYPGIKYVPGMKIV